MGGCAPSRSRRTLCIRIVHPDGQTHEYVIDNNTTTEDVLRWYRVSSGDPYATALSVAGHKLRGGTTLVGAGVSDRALVVPLRTRVGGKPGSM